MTPASPRCPGCGASLSTTEPSCRCGYEGEVRPPTLGGTHTECFHCEGSGRGARRTLAGMFQPGTKLIWQKCDVCDGRGWLPDDEEAEAALGAFHDASPDD